MKKDVVISLKELDKVLDYVVYSISTETESKLKMILVKSIMEAGEKEQKQWMENLKQALSDRLPPNMLHRKREPRSRLFPYLVSGELKDSVKTKIQNISVNSKDIAIIKWWFGLTSKHSNYTTYRYGKPTPNWAGWGVRQLTGKGTKLIPSAKNLVRNFLKIRLKEILEGK